MPVEFGQTPVPTDLPHSAQRGTLYCTVGLMALCCLLYLPNAASLPLADPEESRCALIVQEMLRGGNWLMPHLEGGPYYEKPAPFFWLAAAGQRLTGSIELGGRIVASAAAIAAVLVTFAFARRLGGNAAGMVAGVVLATSPEFFFLARWYRMDMPFTAFMWAALWCFWRHENPAEPSCGKSTRRWVAVYFFAALATLMKGPAGLFLPLAAIGGYLLLSGQWRRLKELVSPAGLGVYLLVAVPWYAAVMIRYPQYGYEFFIVQNLSRYVGHGLGHRQFLGIYYLPILLGGLLPWSVYLPGPVIRTFPRRWLRAGPGSDVLFLWLAAILFFVFFSLSRTRLASYILPVYPPLAVLTGLTLSRWACSQADDRLYKAGARAFVVAVAAFLPALVGVEVYLGTLSPWIAAAAVAVGLFVALQVRALRRDRGGMVLFWGTAGVAAALLYATLRDAPRAYELMSYRTLGWAVGKSAGPADELVAWGDAPFSLPLYAGRLAMERYQPPKTGELDRLVETLRCPRRVYCLVSRAKDLETLKAAAGTELFVLAKQGDAVVVANRRPL